jgi:hypothetical protein
MWNQPGTIIYWRRVEDGQEIQTSTYLIFHQMSMIQLRQSYTRAFETHVDVIKWHMNQNGTKAIIQVRKCGKELVQL